MKSLASSVTMITDKTPVCDIVIRAVLHKQINAMSATEIIPGIYAIKGKFAGEFGYITSYLVVDGDEALVIDPGTAGDPGNRIEKAIRSLDLKPQSDIVGIVCTHGHPDHVGGAALLKRGTAAPIMIHSEDADVLANPDTFLTNRVLLDFAGRMSMKLDKGPLRVNYKGVDPDRTLHDGDTIHAGDIEIKVVQTGGHSAGHCVFLEESRKVLFTGDEVNNFPNDSRKFYLDLTGSISEKSAALEKLISLKVDYLLPAHDVPHILGNVNLELEQVRDGILHFQDTLLHHLRLRSDADIEQLVFDLKAARSVPIPASYDFLIHTTVQVTLRSFKQAGLVRVDSKGVWSIL